MSPSSVISKPGSPPSYKRGEYLPPPRLGPVYRRLYFVVMSFGRVADFSASTVDLAILKK